MMIKLRVDINELKKNEEFVWNGRKYVYLEMITYPDGSVDYAIVRETGYFDRYLETWKDSNPRHNEKFNPYCQVWKWLGPKVRYD